MESRPRVSVLVPSRLERSPRGGFFLEHCVRSVRGQTLAAHVDLQILVGIDPGAEVPNELAALGVQFERGEAPSQPAALNAAAAAMTGDFVAILEDDDTWDPRYLTIAVSALEDNEFVSSTQLELSPEGVVLRINDFPTPSGWVMHRAVFDEVGRFNTEFKLHLDSEWLGRLAETGRRRLHLIESTAPVKIQYILPGRPMLANVLRLGGPSAGLGRHTDALPLVHRLVHPSSGTARIGADAAFRGRSALGISRLTARFGRLPW